MTVSRDALDRLDRHWTVAAVTPQNRERAHASARQQHAQQHVGRQLHLMLFDKPGDQDRLERLALAYELAAIEGLDSLLHPSTDPASVDLRQQAEAGAFRAFELSRGFPLPHDHDARLFHVLHLAALAYCGDRWSDLRRWINEHPEAVQVPSVADVEWDRRVTYRLFDCWVRLLRKNGWDDLDRVREIVAGLREDQKRYESRAQSAAHDAEARTMAFRLVALYHWAKASELLAVYMLQGQPPAVATLLDQHFEAGRDAAWDSGDSALEVLLRWLHVAARSTVAGSVWWMPSVAT